MNNWYQLLCRALMCSIFVCCSAICSPIQLLIVDTYGKDAYYYRNLTLLANSVGFKTDYKNLYDLIENNHINDYDAILFMVNSAIIQLDQATPLQRILNKVYCLIPSFSTLNIPRHCLDTLRSFAQQRNKGIGILLPGKINYTPPLKKNTRRFINSIGQIDQLDPNQQQLISSFINYITRPDAQEGTVFGTALLSGSAITIPPYTMNSLETITPLPLHAQLFEPTIQKLLPIGLLVYHHLQNNTYLISKASAFNFADIEENFFKNPYSIEQRNELLKAAQETLLAFRIYCEQKKLPQNLPPLSLPSPLRIEQLQQKKINIAQQRHKQINKELYQWIHNKPIAAAWLDPYDFFAHEDNLKKLTSIVLQTKSPCNNSKPLVEQLALERGMRIIHDGSFQLLWLECIPEWYLSPHGIRCSQKAEYIERIKKIGTAMHTYFASKNTPLPKIFIGMNLTSNFKSYPVQNATQSISGHLYTKIPSPFDVTNFWIPEVLEIFEEFVTTFKNYLPIDGVFFDFEMYHAPEQTGGYTDLMDFSSLAWKIFCINANINGDAFKTVSKRIAYLQSHKKFKLYFTILEKAAYQLGRTIKRKMRAIVPHLLFAAYAPTLPSSWFYRGIIAGLSSPSEPLIMATFNTDYSSHHAWLSKHKIHLLHGTALMLSKLKHAKDFHHIKHSLTHHDFIWYNRPSRMIYEYDTKQLGKVWWGIEATSADSAWVMHTIKKYHSP